MGEKSSEESSTSIDVGYKKRGLQGRVCLTLGGKIRKHLFWVLQPSLLSTLAYSISLSTENFIRKESDIFVHIKLDGIMWPFYTMAKGRVEPKTATYKKSM